MDSNRYYCFSGLGADARIFGPLEKAGISLIHIPWQEPLPRETIAQYASRLGKYILDPEPNILGLSFGGMIAQEITKQRRVHQLALIATVTTPKEMPRWMRWAGACHLDRVVPLKSYGWLEPIQNRNLGVDGSDRTLLELVREYRKSVSPGFLQWSIGEILRWRFDGTSSPKTIRIHGTQDRLFPIPTDAGIRRIEGAGHLAVYTHANQVARELLQQ